MNFNQNMTYGRSLIARVLRIGGPLVSEYFKMPIEGFLIELNPSKSMYYDKNNKLL